MFLGAIEADQEPYMDGLLKKYEMENCNPTKLPLKPADIDAIERIPIPATPSPQHVRAFSMMVVVVKAESPSAVPRQSSWQLLRLGKKRYTFEPS